MRETVCAATLKKDELAFVTCLVSKNQNLCLVIHSFL